MKNLYNSTTKKIEWSKGFIIFCCNKKAIFGLLFVLFIIFQTELGFLKFAQVTKLVFAKKTKWLFSYIFICFKLGGWKKILSHKVV